MLWRDLQARVYRILQPQVIMQMFHTKVHSMLCRRQVVLPARHIILVVVIYIRTFRLRPELIRLYCNGRIIFIRSGRRKPELSTTLIFILQGLMVQCFLGSTEITWEEILLRYLPLLLQLIPRPIL